jgi:hypothetical protein
MYTHATVTADTLNVRPAPDPQADPPLGQLRRGARVDVLGREGAWYEVTDGAMRGFAHGDYLRFDSTPTANGFLCHDDGLCAPALSLAPAAERRLDPAGLGETARTAARAWNRYGGVLEPLCRTTAVAPAAAVAVLCVESSGQGKTDGGQLVIRFENHVFWDQWGKQRPDAFRAHFTFDAAKRWTGHRYRAGENDAWQTGHTGQRAEWEAFTIARALDENAAMQSISMGAPQIMGFNHAAIGYDSARQMFDAFSADERFHVLGLFDFVKGGGTTSRMLEALRRGEYEQFATYYNGNGQAAAYGARIRAAADAFARIAPAGG